jgi:hypothetical protein
MRIVKDQIVIRGNPKPFVFESELTRHGVIVASDRSRNVAFAVRWSGSEAGGADLGALALDRSTTVAEFVAAAARWNRPARRFTYIAPGGQTGMRVAALIPVRRGWDGSLPAPGWSAANTWSEWQSAEILGRASRTSARPTIAALAHLHADRADRLLRQLQTAQSGVRALEAQRALIAEAIAETRRAADRSGAILFAHPLAITGAPPIQHRAVDAAPWRRAGVHGPVGCRRLGPLDGDERAGAVRLAGERALRRPRARMGGRGIGSAALLECGGAGGRRHDADVDAGAPLNTGLRVS